MQILNESGKGRLPDETIAEFLRYKLLSNPCQNQGYVLDGYPKTADQTRLVFGFGASEDEPEEEAAEEEENGGPVRKIITPEYVVNLEASDEFLCCRVMRMPESLVQGTHYEEERMIQRLSEFRKNNTEDNTMLNLFDVREIHPISINAETDIVENILDIIEERIGTKTGYPPSDQEIEAMLEKKRQETENEQQLEEEKNRRIEDELMEEKQKLMEKWMDMTQLLKEEEEKILVAQTKPMREYLMQFIFPTLTKGLIEVARIKPDDPLDFLAEFLFRENPEGRMFDPAYVKEGEELLRTIVEYQHQVSQFLTKHP